MDKLTQQKLNALWNEGRTDAEKRQIGTTIIMVQEGSTLREAREQLDNWLGL